MTTPPARNTLSGTPTNAQFNAGIGALYDYTVGLLGAAGTPAAARAALGAVGLTGNETIAGVKTFSSAPVVPDDSFTFAKMQNIPTATILGRSTAGTGDVEALTGAQAAALLPMRAPIQPISASVAVNALTLTLNPTTLDFRSTTLGSGAVNTRTVSAAISLTISSGSTLGTINNVASRIAILAIDNNGTVELAVVNLAGGANLNEEGLISTTAEGGAGAADSASTVYSTTARTNVPYRLLGFVASTQATAGTWATSPGSVHASAPLARWLSGFGQTWQNVLGSRALATTYTNTTGRPIAVSVVASNGAGSTPLVATVDGSVIEIARTPNLSGASAASCFIVPASATYSISMGFSPTLVAWNELR